MPVQVDFVPPDDANTAQLVRAQMRELRETWHHRVVSEDEVDAELGPQPTLVRTRCSTISLYGAQG